MKQTDIKPCALCGKGVMHTGLPLFYRVTVERMGVDLRAVTRQHGLELMLGNPVIAHAMGLQEDIAKPIGQAVTVAICEDCAGDASAYCLPRILERAAAKEPA